MYRFRESPCNTFREKAVEKPRFFSHFFEQLNLEQPHRSKPSFDCAAIAAHGMTDGLATYYLFEL
jgi:hypothetical protein